MWVADDLAFPAGDCRTDAVEVTDAQVTNLVREFDGNIYPRETAAFSTPPDRDGTDPVLDGDFTGGGEKTVTLVDNVRDDNFHDFPEAATYIAGFFSPQLNELFDRNVMTIDAYDWKHRSGAEPAERADRRPVHQPPGPAAHVRRHVRPRVAAPACSTTPTRTRSRGSTRACRTTRRPWSATWTRAARCTTRATTATSSATRASASSRRRTTPTRATAAGRRTR